jgi:hypothetical protein
MTGRHEGVTLWGRLALCAGQFQPIRRAEVARVEWHGAPPALAIFRWPTAPANAAYKPCAGGGRVWQDLQPCARFLCLSRPLLCGCGRRHCVPLD